MGVALKAELGSIATLDEREIPWSEITGDQRGDGTQFLVSLAGPDETGLLRSLLLLTSTADARGTARTRFTLDASLATTILGMYACTLILRPTEPEIPDDDVRAFLRESVREVLAESSVQHRLLACNPLGVPPAASQSIFDDRHLSEYRFELPRERWMSEEGPAIHIAAEFTEEVAERSAPVPYLFFPQQADRLRGLATMRIGVGRTEQLRDIVLLDVAAARIASQYGAVARRSLGISDGMRFRDSLVDLTPGDVTRTHAGARELAVIDGRTLDAVSGATWAEVGLMSRSLRALVDAGVDLVGASMSVIASKTVCSFVMPPGGSTGAAAALRDVAAWDHLHPSQSPLSTREPDFNSYWLDWCVPDEPGALLSILDAFEEAVEMSSSGVTMNLEYGLSRVLRGRQEFAGKACFSGPAVDVDRLTASLRGALHRGHPGWADRVTLGPDELSARPWTSLDLFDKFGGAADASSASAFFLTSDDTSLSDPRDSISDARFIIDTENSETWSD